MDTKARLLFIFSLVAANYGFSQNIGFGTNQPQTMVDLNGDLAIRSTALTLANGVLNAVDVTTPKFSSFRVTGPNAPFTIAGMVAASEGKLVTLFNRSGQNMAVANEAGTGNANARIITGTDANINVPNNASIQFQYDNTLTRWVVRNHSAPAVGVAISGGWGLSGNTGNTPDNFIGTTDGAGLTLKQNASTVGFFWGNNVMLGINAGGLSSGNNNAFILGKLRAPLTTSQYSVAIGTDAEISGDYQIIIGAPYHKTGVGLGYNEAPDHTLTVGRRYGNTAALGIYGGGGYHSHFNYGNTEDTYIRGGKLLSKVFINDYNGGDVIIGSPSTSSVGIGTDYPLGFAKLEVRVPTETRPIAVGDGNIGLIHFLGGAGRGLNGVGGYFGTSSNHPLHFFTYGQWAQMTLLQNGAVCIGSMTGATGYKLNVAGKIMAEEIRVQSYAAWPDYVFKPGYSLTPLPTLEKQINLLGHLPNMPDAATIEKEGITLGDMQTRMMEKIEELTLYIIQVDKDNKLLKEEIKALKESRQTHAAQRL